MGIQNTKKSYYELLRKNMKKSYDLIETNEFNQEFSFKISQFNSTKKRTKIFDILIGETFDWKFYLLNKLEKKLNAIGNWENELNTFIETEFTYKKTYENYFLENKIFLNQFYLRNNPQQALNDSKGLHEPLLTLLFDTNEIETYFNEISKLPDRLRTFTNGKLRNSEKSFLSENILDEKNQNKYFSYQVRKHIDLIRRQLDNPKHPIYLIIKKFSEIYFDYLNKCYDKVKNNEDINKKTKDSVIKDIQDFIDIIAIALKLFYMKSINYDYFEHEKDEFINLVCQILFNQKNFEKELFKFFELSNKEKQSQFKQKKKVLGDITPKDVGISIKFRLDKETENFKKNNNYGNESIKEETGIVKYFKDLDIEVEEKLRRSFRIEVGELEMVSSFNDQRKMNLFVSDRSRAESIDKNFIYKPKKKNNKRESTESISSYKEFSEKYNNSSFFSEFDIKIEKDDIHNPYGKAIEFIELIKYYKTPLEKLTIIALESALITTSVNSFWKEQKNLPNNFLRIDADELLSIYLYIICKMNTDTIFTQLDYIQNFIGLASKQSLVGYFYTTVEGCIKFLISAKSKENLAYNKEQN